MVQLDFFDKDVVKTLVPIRTMKPDRVCFVTDKRYAADRILRNIIRIIRAKKIAVECVFVDPYDIRDISTKMTQLIQSIEDPEIYMDFTGGSELMAACGFGLCNEYGIKAVYADLPREVIIDVKTMQPVREINHIRLEDYMEVIGAKRLSNSHYMPRVGEYYAICEMAETLFRHTDAWLELYQFLSTYAKSNMGAMTVHFAGNHRFHHEEEIAEIISRFTELGFWKRQEFTAKGETADSAGRQALEQAGVVIPAEQSAALENADAAEISPCSGADSVLGDDPCSGADNAPGGNAAKDGSNADGGAACSTAAGVIYRYKNQKYKSYMTTYGIWLELYMYIQAQSCFDEVCLGVVIDWNSGDRLDTEDNEIDVLAMKKSVPTFISCKMRKPVASDVYEVGYLAKRLGGESSRGFVATTWPVTRTAFSPRGIYQRLKKMRVGLIETDSFQKKTAADIFNYARQMTD